MLFRTAIPFRLLAGALVVLGLSAVNWGSASAAPPVGLGTAASFGVLAGTAITNTGSSVVTGDLGISPAAAVTGFPPGLDAGVTHAADTNAGDAQNDLTNAYNVAAGAPSTADRTGVDLGGETLTAGVYTASTSMSLTGPVPLTLTGDESSVFIFQAGSTLITGPGAAVLLVGGVNACNVFWQVGTSATLDTGTQFVGNILALTSISVNDGATVQGRLLARNGAVTLINDVINGTNCDSAPPPPTSTTTTTVPAATTTATAATPTTGVTGSTLDNSATSLPTGVTTIAVDTIPTNETTIPSVATTPGTGTLPPITLPVTGSSTHGVALVGTIALALGIAVLIALPRIPRRRRPQG